MNKNIIELGYLDISIYKFITQNINTSRVIITKKQLRHIAAQHPDAYESVLIELKSTLSDPDYIIRDDNHENTGIVIKAISTHKEKYCYVILKVCTDSQNEYLSNSIISGWTISKERLHNYLINKISVKFYSENG